MSMSETSINPNVSMTTTDTTVDGKLELNSASGPVSFDELDQITAKAKREKTSKPKEEKVVKDDKPESKNEKSIDLSSDTDKGKSKESKDGKEKSADKEPGQDQKADEAKLRKLIKAKFQDKEIELDDETLFPITVNGQEEMWTLKELRADKAGKTAWDKQFTELSKQKKAQATNELRLRQAADSVKSIFTEPDHDMRMYKLAQLAGVDPVQYRQNYLNENINVLEKYYSMTEDERKADALAYENKFNKHRADTLEGSIKQEHAQRELSAKLEKLRASHQVSEDEFVSQYDQIQQMIQSGDFDKSTKVTPEYVIETIQKDRLWNAIDTSLKPLNLPWNTEQRGQKILNLVEDAFKLGFKPEEMPDMVSQIWGQANAQKKVQQVQTERQEFLSGKKAVAQVKSSSESPTFFDDL